MQNELNSGRFKRKKGLFVWRTANSFCFVATIFGFTCVTCKGTSDQFEEGLKWCFEALFRPDIAPEILYFNRKLTWCFLATDTPHCERCQQV